MRYEMQMQALGTSLVDDFSQANAGVNIINFSFDKREFDSILTNISSSQLVLQQMKTYIADHRELAVYRPEVDAVSNSINIWSKNINEILALSQELDAIIEGAHNNQRVLTNQSAGVLDYQMELSREEAYQDIDEAARIRRVDRVEQGVDISNRLNAIGASFELMFRSLDISRIYEDMAFLEETVIILTEFRDGSALQYNIDTSTAMLEALEAYRGNIASFLSCFSKRTNLTQAGILYSADALTAVHNLVSAVEASSIRHADETIKITSTLRIVSFVIVIAGVVISMLLAFYISDLISKPLINATEKLREVNDNIGSAANELSDASNSLAEASSEQAASIEETSATMNQTASMILQTVENTFLAKELANEAGITMLEALGHAEELIKSMSELSASSSEIGKIVSTISSISFQTNILALNASVEATRAGEAGRSFMVVAEEVRSLAQQSAQMANDTDAIIKNNNALTLKSVDDSNSVSQIMDAVGEKARKTAELLSEISIASEEQSRGIQQINLAMSEMEKATQSSAAISEESAAAAIELQSQTFSLQQIYEDICILVYGKKQ
ncbi:MAG: methyl-accepting chemotaxis protein [Symbiobacteriaceae bacterium]|nr:methyl-accepting chemotaxis protein [Symbiobacteriaceae bacterium]